MFQTLSAFDLASAVSVDGRRRIVLRGRGGSRDCRDIPEADNYCRGIGHRPRRTLESLMISRIVVFLVIFSLQGNSFATGQDAQTVLSRNDAIGPNDTLNIVAGEAEEISKTWRVSSTGDLDLPMV